LVRGLLEELLDFAEHMINEPQSQNTENKLAKIRTASTFLIADIRPNEREADSLVGNVVTFESLA
jgi:hypothetical protein